jgi:DNA-binding CsgD family transcriptional regulator
MGKPLGRKRSGEKQTGRQPPRIVFPSGDSARLRTASIYSLCPPDRPEGPSTIRRGVLTGPYAQNALDHTLFSGTAWDLLANALHLSTRELQVVQHVFDDQKESAIANDLGISPHTVKAYLQRIYHKLHVSNRVQLILRIFAEYLDVRA